MPKSKIRKHHHDHRPPPANAEKQKKGRSAVLVSIVFFALIGIGIAFFASDSPLWLIAGAVLGAGAGYFFGGQVDKSFSKK